MVPYEAHPSNQKHPFPFSVFSSVFSLTMTQSTTVCLFLLFLLSLSTTSLSGEDSYQCIYSVYVRTGSIIKGGTDSTISLTLYDSDGYGIRIRDLESWGGLMGPGYNYFERGNLDMFSGRGPCLDRPVCAMNLTSDGSGAHHGWYCNYVEVTTTGPHIPCDQQLFTVEQWLATDAPPYELSVFRNKCPDYVDRKGALKRVEGEKGSSDLKAIM